MSKILQAIEAKRNELEKHKESMRQTVRDVTEKANKSIESVTEQAQKAIETSTNELEVTFRNELRKAKQEVMRSNQIIKWLMISLLVVLMALSGVQQWHLAEGRQKIAEYQNQIQWLWIVNEDKIKAAVEAEKAKRQGKK